MALVLWARHGENVANLTRTFSYIVFDGDLTPAGRQQARDLAYRLARRRAEPIGQLVCSPLRRARQTAEIVGQLLGLPVTAESEHLRELNVGELDGRSDAEAWQVYAAVLRAWQADEPAARFPGGEDCFELHRRVSQALATVNAAANGRQSLVIAHGGALRQALPMLTGDPDPGTDMPTGSYATLELDAPGQRPRLLSWPEPATGQ